jgi:hypothetical protein
MGKIIDRALKRERLAKERRREREFFELTYEYWSKNPPLVVRVLDWSERVESWWKRLAAAIRGEKG